MNDASADSPSSGLAGPKPQGEGWSRTKRLTLIALVLAAQIAFVFVFGQKQFAPSRAVSNVPLLRLVDSADEMAALNDPTLFALPNPKDFSVAVWLRMPDVNQPSFRWTESPRWLSLAAENLGTVFSRFMQTNQFAQFQFDFKPPVTLSEPVLPVATALPQSSTLQISGDLAQRRLLNENEIQLPSLSFNDVIAPSKVQALVDANGLSLIHI